MLKLACSTMIYRPDVIQLKEALKSISELGYDGVVTTSVRKLANNITPDTSKKERRETKELIDELGLELCAHASDIYDFTDPNKEKREEEIKYYKSIIELASDLGAKIVKASDVGVCPREADVELVLGWLVDAYRECQDFADELGLKMSIEAVSHGALGWYSIKSGIPLADVTLDFIGDVGSNNLGVWYDAGHYHVLGQDYLKAARKLGNLIWGVDVKDIKVIKRKKERLAKQQVISYYITEFGLGEMDFHALVATLNKINYKGMLTFEDYWQPDVAAFKALVSMRKLVGIPSGKDE